MQLDNPQVTQASPKVEIERPVAQVWQKLTEEQKLQLAISQKGPHLLVWLSSW